MTVFTTGIIGNRHAQRAGRPLFTALMGLFAVQKQRRALRDLDADRLYDLGISASDAAIEAAKPIWSPARHWQQ